MPDHLEYGEYRTDTRDQNNAAQKDRVRFPDAEERALLFHGIEQLQQRRHAELEEP